MNCLKCNRPPTGTFTNCMGSETRNTLHPRYGVCSSCYEAMELGLDWDSLRKERARYLHLHLNRTTMPLRKRLSALWDTVTDLRDLNRETGGKQVIDEGLRTAQNMINETLGAIDRGDR